MPYINDKEQRQLDDLVSRIITTTVDTPGKLNYLITRLIHRVLVTHKVNYTLLNGLIGTLECAKLELYRRVIAIYENKKIKENGDQYEIDRYIGEARVRKNVSCKLSS